MEVQERRSSRLKERWIKALRTGVTSTGRMFNEGRGMLSSPNGSALNLYGVLLLEASDLFLDHDTVDFFFRSQMYPPLFLLQLANPSKSSYGLSLSPLRYWSLHRYSDCPDSLSTPPYSPSSLFVSPSSLAIATSHFSTAIDEFDQKIIFRYIRQKEASSDRMISEDISLCLLVDCGVSFSAMSYILNYLL